MPTLRSESAPRRSSRVVQAEKAAAKAKEAASAAADKASKKARPAAKKAGKVVKKTAAKAKTAVRKNVVKPAAKKVAKAAGVDVKEDEEDKPKSTSRKRKADEAEDDKDDKEDSKKQKKDEGASGKYTIGDIVEDVVLHNGALLSMFRHSFACPTSSRGPRRGRQGGLAQVALRREAPRHFLVPQGSSRPPLALHAGDLVFFSRLT